jgi:hypothetical protein
MNIRSRHNYLDLKYQTWAISVLAQAFLHLIERSLQRPVQYRITPSSSRTLPTVCSHQDTSKIPAKLVPSSIFHPPLLPPLLESLSFTLCSFTASFAAIQPDPAPVSFILNPRSFRPVANSILFPILPPPTRRSPSSLSSLAKALRGSRSVSHLR